MTLTTASRAPRARAQRLLAAALGLALVGAAVPAAALAQDEAAQPPHDQPGPAAERLLYNSFFVDRAPLDIQADEMDIYLYGLKTEAAQDLRGAEGIEQLSGRILFFELEVLTGPVWGAVHHPRLAAVPAGFRSVAGNPAQRRAENEGAIETDLERRRERGHGCPAGRHRGLRGASGHFRCSPGEKIGRLGCRHRDDYSVEMSKIGSAFRGEAPSSASPLELFDAGLEADA